MGPSRPDVVAVQTAGGGIVLMPRSHAPALPHPASAAAPSPTAAPSPASAGSPPAVGGAIMSLAAAHARALKPSSLPLEARYALCRSVGEECVQEAELRALLEKKAHPIAYDGFEPSGRMHIAQGVLKAINVNRLTKAGCHFIFWVADLFALMNGKYDGDLKKIRTCGQYFVEVWRAAGMEMDNVSFLWASDEINAHSNDYILRMLDIARRFNVPRIVRCCTAMGRKEEDDLSAAQIFYPCMQANDIFFLKVSSRFPFSPLPRLAARPLEALFWEGNEELLVMHAIPCRPRPTDRACFTGTPGRRVHFPRRAVPSRGRC
jgi:hypothetical protein